MKKCLAQKIEQLITCFDAQAFLNTLRIKVKLSLCSNTTTPRCSCVNAYSDHNRVLSILCTMHKNVSYIFFCIIVICFWTISHNHGSTKIITSERS